MNAKELDKRYPDFFKNISVPEVAQFQEIEVYRFCVEGVINRRAFDSSYADKYITKVNSGLRIDVDSNKPGEYSTSVYYDIQDLLMKKSVFTKNRPKTIIAKGITDVTCGPCAITAEWKKCNDSHVDWWIFEEAHPEVFFSEVKDND